jgi:hypothetical protein
MRPGLEKWFNERTAVLFDEKQRYIVRVQQWREPTRSRCKVRSPTRAFRPRWRYTHRSCQRRNDER